MSSMGKGPPTKDQPPNSGGRPISQAPAGAQTDMEQQQHQPNITISRVPAPPTSVHQTPAAVPVTNQQSLGNNQTVAAQIPITQSLAPTNNAFQQAKQQLLSLIEHEIDMHQAGGELLVQIQRMETQQKSLVPTTTGPVVAAQNSNGIQVPSPARSTNVSPPATQVKVSSPAVSNNVPSLSVKPPALAPITHTPKPQVPASPALKSVESKSVKEVKEKVVPVPQPKLVEKKAPTQAKPEFQEPAEKLTFFYKNEFLAVRNADGGFYICQTAANVTRKGQQRINIRWYNEEDPGSGIYIPDYFDNTEFECVLTTVEMEKSGKANFKIPEAELKRVQQLLKNSLDVEKGIVPNPEITEKNPDGPTNKKSMAKKSLKRARDESEDEDDDDSDYVVLAKTMKASVNQPARERPQRASVVATPDTASKKRKAPEPAKAPPAKKVAVVPEKTLARSAKGKVGEASTATTTAKPVEPPKPQKNEQKKAPEATTTKASNNKKAPAKAPPTKSSTTTTASKKETPLAAITSTNTGRPTRATRK